MKKKYNILVIGDSCEDIYHYGKCHKLSPEAPVPIFHENSVEIRQGMSGNVFNNLKNLGLSVNHYTNDCNLIQKHRYVDLTYNQQIFRMDVENKAKIKPISIEMLDNLKNVDAIVISDYNKGYITEKFALELTSKFSRTPIFVDTKKNDISCYENSIIKINQKENSEITRWPNNSKTIVTLGSNGALYNGRIFSVEKNDVFDVCGAGDVFLSALVFSYLESNSIIESIKIANKCASLSVSKFGCYVLSANEYHDIIKNKV
jgi:D-beta-D-heptose 7-phosphate kinase/D-beta-D-heptose 1-phosphate adenosyltransferase